MAKDAPENVKYAQFGIRMLASIIDTLLSTLVLIPVYNIVSSIIEKGPPPLYVIEKLSLQQALDPDEVALLHHYLVDNLISMGTQSIFLGVIVIVFWVYRSATPGKMILGMKVVDAKTFDHPTNKKLIIRYLSYFVSTIPFGLGFIWISFDKKARGWHDYIAGTAVIRTQTGKSDA